MTLKNSISALCPLACCLRRFEAKHKCLSVRQSLLIIFAKRWHSQTAEGHTGLQALGWPRQEAAGRILYVSVGASSPGWRQGMVGQRWVWGAHRSEAQQLCLYQRGWAAPLTLCQCQCHCLHSKGDWCSAGFMGGPWSSGQVGWTSSSFYHSWNTFLCCYARLSGNTSSLLKWHCSSLFMRVITSTQV